MNVCVQVRVSVCVRVRVYECVHYAHIAGQLASMNNTIF